VHGIEIKVHRSDWLRELKRPDKSAVIQSYCDFWWVCAPKGLVKLEELPETWGLLELHGEKTLRAKRKAPKLDAEPLDRRFVAAIARRCAEAQQRWIHPDAIADELKQARDRGAEMAKTTMSYELSEMRRKLDRVQTAVKDFEEHSGVQINRYNGAQVGEHFALARQIDHLGMEMRRLFDLAPQLAHAQRLIEKLKAEHAEITAAIEKKADSDAA
jgi:hypothetical protein